MSNYNPENERIKRQYLNYLKEARQYSEASLDAAAKALSRFEEHTRYKSFKAFHTEQASSFKRRLAEQTGQRSGEKLSKATLHVTLTQLKQFFIWLAGQPGYKARIQYPDADYFNSSGTDTRIATVQRERKAPTLEQVKHVIETMPRNSEIERRNRALVAFTLLTGARDSAIASMKLKHVDLTEGCVYQDAREVKTKFSKTFTTYFFRVGDDIREIVTEWVRFLREEKLWGNDDPLFPATRVAPGKTRQFEAIGLSRTHWSTASPIRIIFRESFKHAGVSYFNPHSIRNTLARLGEQVCKTPEEFKAWSQNFGHDRVMTTFTSYGAVRVDRQGEIIRKLGASAQPIPPGADALLERLRAAGVNFSVEP